jgi:hypothetical protein
MTRSDDRPAWIAEVQAWVNATLDEEDARFHQNLANNAKTYAHVLDERLSRLDDDEKARRKERGLAKTQEWKLELALRQAMQGNIEPLQREMQKQDPRLARFINLPRLDGRGKHFEKPPHPARDRLEDAVAELPRVRYLLKLFHEKKPGYPRRRLTAKQILAERWDLTENEIRKRCISHARLKRERASSDE